MAFLVEMTVRVGECHSQFFWVHFWPCQCCIQRCLVHVVGEAAPGAASKGTATCKARLTTPQVTIMEPVISWGRQPSFSKLRVTGKCDPSTSLMIPALSDAGCLILGHPPITEHAFLEKGQFLRLLRDNFLQTAQCSHFSLETRQQPLRTRRRRG